MRIAVVGAGVAGLACAYRLHARHEVTVFEAGPEPGGHARTVDVALEDGTYPVDTGFIVYNRPNYPRFGRLLDELGIVGVPTTMSFSVRAPHLGLEYQGGSLNGLFADRRNLLSPRFHRFVADILRFHRAAPRLLADRAPETESLSVAAFARAEGLGERFLEGFLVPLTAALWSAPPGEARAFPARFVVRFLAQHRMLQAWGRPQWLTIPGGSRRYVERLIAPFRHRVRARTPVRSIRAAGGAAVLELPSGRERFDHAVIAAHADDALSLLADPSPLERGVLGAFPYGANDAWLHDHAEAVMPRRRRAWAGWNARVPAADPDRATVTYYANALERLDAPRDLCITLNDHAGIDPGRVHDRVRFRHPLAAAGQESARARHGELVSGTRSFCGAYWGYGFHEDGVASAERVCAALDGCEAEREAAA